MIFVKLAHKRCIFWRRNLEKSPESAIYTKNYLVLNSPPSKGAPFEGLWGNISNI
jgi:hypothetical protein